VSDTLQVTNPNHETTALLLLQLQLLPRHTGLLLLLLLLLRRRLSLLWPRASMYDTTRALHSTTALHPCTRHASRATEPLHRRLLRRMAATWRPCLALQVRLSHVHGGTGIRARDMRTRGVHVRARVRDPRATTVAQLGVGRVWRLILGLRLRALLLGWLLTHLYHLPLSHKLSVVLLVGGGIPSSVHVSILLGHSLLLLRCVRLLLLVCLLLLRQLLLRSLLLVLGPLIRTSSIAIGAVRNHSIILIRSLVVIVHRRAVCSGLLLGIANTGSSVHSALTHLTRRLRLVLQLFSSKVRELYLGHLRVTCPQLILDLYDRRNVAR
jgi:hypothetical protein